MNPKQLLEELKSQPKKSLGQNFLVNPEVIRKILTKVKDLKPNKIVEIGPGLGAITEPLLELNIPIVLIELDTKFASYWREKGIKTIEADALSVNWIDLHEGNTYLLVSNLPYQISSSIVIDRSVCDDLSDKMILMFQKEVAQRITAAKSTKDYGLLSVIAQIFWKIHKVCDADPKSFYPSPNVVSRVLCFERKNLFSGNKKEFLRFVKAAFAQRRKLLIKNISAIFSEDKILKVFKGLSIKEKARAEELSPEELLNLFTQLVT